MRALRAAALAVLVLAGVARADEIAVRINPLASFTIFSQVTRFGAFEWRGGLELASDDKRFGGLSSLALSSDGTHLLAVSDSGYWFKAKLAYENGKLTGLGQAEIAPVLDDKGQVVKSKVKNDAEALAAWTPGAIDGKVIVGFESRVRAGAYDLGAKGFKARFEPMALPKEIAKGPGNKELESIGHFTAGPLKGGILAISELNLDPDRDIRAWVWGHGKPMSFGIKRLGDYAITDAAILPNGDILTVERSYAPGSLPGMAIRRIRASEIIAGGSVAPALLLESRAPVHAIDNMEGIAVHRQDGETRVTLVSDDNFDKGLQRTLLLQFAMVP